VRVALGLSCVLAFAAQAKEPKRSAVQIAKGKAAFAVWCVACHGEKGAGDGPTAHTLDPRPRNFASEKFKQGAGAKQIFSTLSKGVPRSAMVAYKNLSDDERWALAFYVLELKAGRP
jgi:high-affinity iron transporter